MKKYLGYLAIIVAIGIFLAVLYINGGYMTVTRPYSSYTILTSSWEKYKKQFITADGRVFDPSQNNLTTSEGQSYAMLRSVWIDDKTEFDLVWNWTERNLKRPADNLFGWKWGKLAGGRFGYLPQGGDNTAADADSDIALALILASRRWHQNSYQETAKTILGDIWKNETAELADKKRYVIAGNWARNNREVVINPSYFAPYAWRIFASVDPNHNWTSLISPSYELLSEASNPLPPDWVAVASDSGKLTSADNSGLTRDYSYDAMRIPWRIGLDYLWNNNQQAADYLATFDKLATDYRSLGKLPASYQADGTANTSYEDPVMYATSLGYFVPKQSDLAKKIFDEKILRLYSNDANSFDSKLGYYQQNWLWFGAALYYKFLDHY